MYIKELYIGAFGGLHDRAFSFAPGVNLIEGKNEAGKSTLCAFIKFIFYGLAAKERGNPLPDRKRYMPFGEGSAHGTLTLRAWDKDYLISRTVTMTGKTAARDEYVITDLTLGTPAFEGKSPAEAFLGMSEGLFVRTAYVPQLTGTAVDGTEVSSAIENLLFSAEEEIDSAKVLRALDSARAVLLHKNSKGGKLYEAICERDALDAALAADGGAREELAIIEEQLAALTKSEQENNRLLGEAESLIARYECAALLTEFEKADEKEAHIASLRAKRGELAASGVPALEDIHEPVRLAEAIRAGRAAYAAAEQIPVPDEPTDPLAPHGGESAVRRVLSRKKRGAKTLKALGAAALAAAVALGAAGAAHYMGLIGLPAPYHLPLIAACGGLAVYGCIHLIAGILRGKGLRKALSEYGISDISELSSIAHQASNNRLLYEKALSDRKARLSRLAGEQKAKETEGNALCERYGAVYTGESSLEDLALRLTAVREQCSSLDASIESEERLLADMRTALAGQDRDALAAELAADPHEVMAETDIKELRSRSAFGTAGKERMREKITELEKARIEVRERAKKESAAKERLCALNTAIGQMSARYDALRLAYERMEQAAMAVKEQVSPALASRAGELMAAATGGKYDRLLVANDMSLSYADKAAGDAVRQAEYLSRGTKDLAYVSLRIALCELLTEGNPPPMIFDESFAAMDDGRLASVYAVISSCCGQALVLTSQHRDRALLPGANVISM